MRAMTLHSLFLFLVRFLFFFVFFWKAMNKHLESLSEHHDIPKVSWTK